MTSQGRHGPAVCLDVGSTWTKGVLVGPDGSVIRTALSATTTGDVLTGIDAVTAELTGADPEEWPREELLACSSAGGGLRLAVLGQDRLASIEAGHQVACCAGSIVVHVHTGPLEPADVRTLRACRPGVVLLVGGRDGGDPGVLLHNSARLARARVRFPIVLAGDAAVQSDALALLRSTGRSVVAADNVLPRPGEIVAEPARAAVAEVFLRHVFGGRGLSAGPRFRRLARSVTPDAVHRGAVELAALHGAGAGAASAAGVLVVDVGSATTDVHSSHPGSAQGLRTVEGDLGMRSAAAGVLVEGQAEGVVDPVEADLLGPTIARLTEEIGYLPTDVGSAAEDRRIAALAAVLALRRHLKVSGGAAEHFGLVVLTGGVLRQKDRDGLSAVESTLRTDPVLASALDGAEIVIDAVGAMAPAGLLAAGGRTEAAHALLRDQLLG